MTTVTLPIPEDLARDLENTGLMRPEAAEIIGKIFRDGLRRYMAGDLIRTADRLLVRKGQAPTLEEIQEEVNAVRREIRHAAGS